MFTPIDLETWPRREHFDYYRSLLPVGYTVTVRVDVTRFRAMLTARNTCRTPTIPSRLVIMAVMD